MCIFLADSAAPDSCVYKSYIIIFAGLKVDGRTKVSFEGWSFSGPFRGLRDILIHSPCPLGIIAAPPHEIQYLKYLHLYTLAFRNVFDSNCKRRDVDNHRQSSISSSSTISCIQQCHPLDHKPAVMPILNVSVYSGFFDQDISFFFFVRLPLAALQRGIGWLGM